MAHPLHHSLRFAPRTVPLLSLRSSVGAMAKPFYGYATSGTVAAYHYFDGGASATQFAVPLAMATDSPSIQANSEGANKSRSRRGARLGRRAVSFEYLDPAAINELPGTRLGVVAQEVETVFPDWVEEGADGFKRVTFRGFEGVTIEALRELRAEKDAQIEALRSQLDAKDSAIAGLEARLARIEASMAKAGAR